MVKNESERRYKVAAYIWSPVLHKGIYIKAVREGAAGLGDLQVFHTTSARGGEKNGEAIINNSGVYKPMSIFLIMSRDRLQWNDLSKGYVLPTPPLSHSLCFLSWYSADHWSHLCLLVKNRFPGLSPRDSALVLGHGHYEASGVSSPLSLQGAVNILLYAVTSVPSSHLVSSTASPTLLGRLGPLGHQFALRGSTRACYSNEVLDTNRN